jgi:hypothetical protein
MSDENKPQVIIHKSNWGAQLIKVIIIGIVLFFLIKKNPEKIDFIRESVKEYSLTKLGLNRAEANGTAEISATYLGEYIQPFIERNDFVLFSMYDLQYDNEYFKIKVKAFGLWDHIFFYEGSVKKLKPQTSEEEVPGC